MKYDVIINADGVSRGALLDAAQTFRKSLDAEMDSDELFLRCFQAYQRLNDHGRTALTADEDRDATAWILAFNTAEVAVKDELQPGRAAVTFRIAHP